MDLVVLERRRLEVGFPLDCSVGTSGAWSRQVIKP